jgi:hypothetical protein
MKAKWYSISEIHGDGESTVMGVFPKAGYQPAVGVLDHFGIHGSGGRERSCGCRLAADMWD